MSSSNLALQGITRHQAGNYTCIASNVEGDGESPWYPLKVMCKWRVLSRPPLPFGLPLLSVLFRPLRQTHLQARAKENLRRGPQRGSGRAVRGGRVPGTRVLQVELQQHRGDV